MPFCFLHASDLHLDSPFSVCSRALSVELKNALFDSTYVALKRLVSVTIDQSASFVLFSGDIFDSGDLSITAEMRFSREMERLHREDIEAFLVFGNHDPLAHRRVRDMSIKHVKTLAKPWRQCV